ncbi:MAG: hypothetical protein KF823_06530 [Xanthomonadales bacterium]|nr:hypothetical protein [Xanthomonadales bacterium]
MFAILQRRLTLSGALAGLTLMAGLVLGQPLPAGQSDPLDAATRAGEVRHPAVSHAETETARTPSGQRAHDLSWPFFSFGRNGGRRSW